jgi:hypothetical protein
LSPEPDASGEALERLTSLQEQQPSSQAPLRQPLELLPLLRRLQTLQPLEQQPLQVRPWQQLASSQL